MEYRKQGTVVRVVDGDTLDVKLILKSIHEDLGFKFRLDLDIPHTIRVRLKDINAPESFGPMSSDAGRAAKAFLTELLPPGTHVEVTTFKEGPSAYNRYSAVVRILNEDGEASAPVNQTIVESGHAVSSPYSG